jgi:hypothetical protein
LENALESTIEKLNAPKPPQGPSPEQQQAEAMQQMEQAKMQQSQQAEQMKMQATMQAEQMKMQAAQQLEQMKSQMAAELEQFRAQQAIQLEQMKQQAETERQAYKSQLDAQTKLQIAEMQTVGKYTPKKMTDLAAQITEAATLQNQEIAQKVQGLEQLAGALIEGVAEMRKPKRRVLQRDPVTGRAIGAVEITD